MDRFAFMIHPIDSSDIARKFSFLKRLPDSILDKIIYHLPPIKVSEITGIKSVYDNAEIIGNFLGCTLTSKQMVELPTDTVIDKIIRTGKIAEKLGAKILGLGAMTSVVGDAGYTVAQNLNIPVTTGNSYTIATAMEGTEKAAEMLDIDIKGAEVLIIGANGSIGSVCAQMMARKCGYLTLVSRDVKKLERLSAKILRETGLAVKISNRPEKAIKKADIIITVTSSVDCVINPEDLKPGALVCDVARPRDVSKRVAELRDDVLIIEGGLVEVPGNVDFNLNFGYPPKLALACMAETMILALEKNWTSYTLGREITIKQADEIHKLGKKHGFKLAGFRSFEKIVKPEVIERVRYFTKQNTKKQFKVKV
ncbi:MAG: shikimate dehydrogenase [Clostridia bacterium]|nr:shikimate dehydrogenase [Clostridia bacterium]